MSYPALLLIAVAAAVLPGGCTRENPAGGGAQALRAGGKVLTLDFRKTATLTVARNDAASGQAWFASVARETPAAGMRAKAWRFDNVPGGADWPDRIADGTFIEHLLDTLSTLTAVEPVEDARPQDLGLEPPGYALRWTPAEGGVLGLRIGNPSKKIEAAAYARLETEDGLSPEVWVIRGAAIRMLGHLIAPADLRHRRLATFTRDDVMEWELKPAAGASWFAQRAGGAWADREGRRLGDFARKRLEELVSFEVEAFIDDPSLFPSIEARPEATALFRHRKGRSTELRLHRLGARPVASASDRPGSWFYVTPEAARLFLPPSAAPGPL